MDNCPWLESRVYDDHLLPPRVQANHEARDATSVTASEVAATTENFQSHRACVAQVIESAKDGDSGTEMGKEDSVVAESFIAGLHPASKVSVWPVRG